MLNINSEAKTLKREFLKILSQKIIINKLNYLVTLKSCI